MHPRLQVKGGLQSIMEYRYPVDCRSFFESEEVFFFSLCHDLVNTLSPYFPIVLFSFILSLSLYCLVFVSKNLVVIFSLLLVLFLSFFLLRLVFPLCSSLSVGSSLSYLTPRYSATHTPRTSRLFDGDSPTILGITISVVPCQVS